MNLDSHFPMILGLLFLSLEEMRLEVLQNNLHLNNEIAKGMNFFDKSIDHIKTGKVINHLESLHIV